MASHHEPSEPQVHPSGTVRKLLAASTLFDGLSADAVDAALERADRVRLSAGEILFRQGEPGDAMYVVITGRIEVVVEPESSGEPERVVRETGRGGNLGELALLTGDPRSATIRAVRDTHLLRLRREAFEALLDAHPDTALRLTRILARWLREGNRGTARRPRIATVGVIPGTPGADAAGFARALERSFRSWGDVLVVDVPTVEEALGPDVARTPEGTPAHRRVTAWLDRQELEHRFLVYVADRRSTPWSRRCLRQSDVILTIVRAGCETQLLPVARDAVRERSRRRSTLDELVLRHASGSTAPGEARRWLGRGSFSRHHHVRDGVAGDIERVARHVAGRAVGIVLGGGGARGFAHVGVVRALREAGVPLDRLGGASMGALVAALFAAGMDADEVEERLRRSWERADHRPHKHLTFPAYSLVTGEQARRMLEWTFADRRIEDLRVPFFCTTTNLTRGSTMVHREGSVRRWLEATVSIPGIVPPGVTDDGELLVDGALLNNLPADVMVEEDRGPVAAVGVSSDSGLRVAPGSATPSGWEAVTGRLLPFRESPSFPGIFRILHRSAVIGSVHSERNVGGDVDLHLRPPLAGFDMFDWRSLGRIVDAGYRHTAARLEAEPELVRALTRPGPGPRDDDGGSGRPGPGSGRDSAPALRTQERAEATKPGRDVPARTGKEDS